MFSKSRFNNSIACELISMIEFPLKNMMPHGKSFRKLLPSNWSLQSKASFNIFRKIKFFFFINIPNTLISLYRESFPLMFSEVKEYFSCCTLFKNECQRDRDNSSIGSGFPISSSKLRILAALWLMDSIIPEEFSIKKGSSYWNSSSNRGMIVALLILKHPSFPTHSSHSHFLSIYNLFIQFQLYEIFLI